MSRGENPASVAAAAWRRAAGARERARRAEEAAEKQESLAARSGRDVHLRMAATHRRMAAIHLSSAELQQSYARRMTAWSRMWNPRPLFMTGVAEACDADSAALTLVGRDHAQLAFAASDDTSRAAQEFEFILEEGPVRDATTCHGPVLAADPGAIERRWPGYGPELTGLGLTGVLAVPLESTGLCIGALTLYDPKPGPKGYRTCADIAEALTQTVLLGPDPDPELYGGTDHRDTVHQAAGAHAVRSGLPVNDALALIKGRAFTLGLSTEAVALRVLANLGELP
ncbi:GAF domain-containing protein [Streptomyces sp. CRN 30]|uniref:GAF domain-containing protein n=1 Tax=Streptomyces sp. CRN 30 TaxID=3075613 RepID=UPI002A7FB627|nr:GAF domain-containing protein [Streptomyces sp. CRN 30]